MPDFERTAHLEVSPDRAFAFVSDPRNLPDFVAMMAEARPTAGDHRLHVIAEVNGRREEGEAHFRADPATRSLAWGGSHPGYHGSLRIDGAPEATSSIHLRLHTRDDTEREDVERALDTTMENLADRLTG